MTSPLPALKNPDNWHPLSLPVRKHHAEQKAAAQRSDLWFVGFCAWLLIIAVAYSASR